MKETGNRWTRKIIHKHFYRDVCDKTNKVKELL